MNYKPLVFALITCTAVNASTINAQLIPSKNNIQIPDMSIKNLAQDFYDHLSEAYHFNLNYEKAAWNKAKNTILCVYRSIKTPFYNESLPS